MPTDAQLSTFPALFVICAKADGVGTVSKQQDCYCLKRVGWIKGTTEDVAARVAPPGSPGVRSFDLRGLAMQPKGADKPKTSMSSQRAPCREPAGSARRADVRF